MRKGIPPNKSPQNHPIHPKQPTPPALNFSSLHSQDPQHHLSQLRNKLAEMFTRCTDRQKTIKKFKQQRARLSQINKQNEEINCQLDKLRDMVKNVLFLREKERVKVGK